MSRRRRAALRSARTGSRPTTGSPTLTKVKTPADVATMIPYLLGFQPLDSLVVVSLQGPTKRFGPVMRIDLERDPLVVEQHVGAVVDALTSNGFRLVLVVAYSDDAALADPMAAVSLTRLEKCGVTVEDAFRVGSDRWWSYTCVNPDCCDPAGMPFEPASRVAAEAVLAGMSFASDRDSLRELFARAPAAEREAVDAEVTRLRASDASVRPALVPATLPGRVRDLLDDARALTPTDIAWLALAVQTRRGQDAAAGLVERRTAEAHAELWREVMRFVTDSLLPPVGCLAALCAWVEGRGVMASHAVERVFEVAPRHPFACQIDALLRNAVDPRTWDLATAADRSRSAS